MHLSHLLTASLAADAEAPTLFPFPFSFHLTFVIIATIFFGVSFARMKRPYQILLALGIPFSLLIWVADAYNNRILYYVIGVVEFLILASAFLTSIFLKPEKNQSADSNTEE